MLEGMSPWQLRPRHWLALFGFGLAIYFGYHAVIGSRGLLGWDRLQRELEASRQELEALREQRIALERRVKRLRSTSLDPDLIDELARLRLSFVDPLDVIILLDKEGEQPAE